MIRLSTLVLHNFLSHSNSEITFKQYNGLTLIEGRTTDGHYSSNGSGKSTIIEGIYYAFTGKTLRGLTADAIVNRVEGKNTFVELEFYSNRTLYKIIRYRKHNEFGNDLKLFRDGEDISKRIPTETQQDINQLIEIPEEILSSIMIMGEGLASRFTQLSDPAKKSLLEGTIRLSHDLDKVRESAKSKLSEVSQSIIYKNGLLDAHSKLKEEQLALSGLDYDLLVDERGDITASIKDIDDRLNELNSSISSNTSKLQVIQTAISNYNLWVSQKDYTDNEISKFMQQLDEVLSEIPTCPLCHQLLKDPEEVKKSIQKEIDSRKVSITTLDEAISKLPDIGVLNSKKSQLEEAISHIRQDYTTLSSQRSKLSNDLQAVLNDIQKYEHATSISKDIEEEDKVLSEEVASLIKDKERLEYINKNIFSPTGVIVLILGSVVDYVDQRLQVYNNLLLDKKFHLTFKKNKIAIEGSGVSYQSLSNGEKRRLDISIQFALHDYIYTHCGIGFDTMFIDEILDTLDSVGVNNIIEVLNLKRSYCSMDRIFIVTHNNELKEYFDSVLSVSKNANGITTIS